MPSFKPWKWFNEKRVETISRPGLIMKHRRVPDSFIRDQNMMRQKWPAFCAFFYFFTTRVSKTDSAKLNCPFNFAHVSDICIENLVMLRRINRSKFLTFKGFLGIMWWYHDFCILYGRQTIPLYSVALNSSLVKIHQSLYSTKNILDYSMLYALVCKNWKDVINR